MKPTPSQGGLTVSYLGCRLAAGWKQQPPFRVHMVSNRSFARSAPYSVYIIAHFCRLIYRTECNRFNGEICVLYRNDNYDIYSPDYASLTWWPEATGPCSTVARVPPRIARKLLPNLPYKSLYGISVEYMS